MCKVSMNYVAQKALVPKCPFQDEWIKKTWYTDTIQCRVVLSRLSHIQLLQPHGL